MYYESPSQPEKRRQLRVPSPRMVTMSIFAGGRHFKPSIPGYGGGVKKAIRRPEASVSQSMSPTSVGQDFQEEHGRTTDPGLRGPVLSCKSDPPIPVSLLGLLSQGSATILTEQWEMAETCPALPATDSLLQQAEARFGRNCVVKLFQGVAGTSKNWTADVHRKSGGGFDIAKVPICRRVVVSEHLSTLEFVKSK
jgi:hypothetical protein